mmetsp:Transcript_28546/g.31716  ORF Transcript_28546/g.31716 Transcript_28546/m.31716 type:complete len:80 (-) Transcript_28546:1563-1802(-)
MNIWLLAFIIGYAAITEGEIIEGSLNDACMNNLNCYLMKENISKIIFEDVTVYELNVDDDIVLGQNIILQAGSLSQNYF